MEGFNFHNKHFNGKIFNRSLKFIWRIIYGFISGDGYYEKKPERQLVQNLLMFCTLCSGLRRLTALAFQLNFRKR